MTLYNLFHHNKSNIIIIIVIIIIHNGLERMEKWNKKF